MKNILIIRLSSLGDVILVSSVLDSLYKRFHIDILTYGEYANIFAYDKRVRKVLSAKKTDFKSISSIKSLAFSLNGKNYDYVFDLHATLKTHLLSFFLKPKVFRYNKRVLLRRLMVLFKPFKSKWLYVPDLYADVFKNVNVNIKNPRPRIFLPKVNAENLIPKKPFVVISPGARWETKRYPLGRFVGLGRIFLKDGFNVVAIGGRGEEELGKPFEYAGMFNLVGKLSVLESMAVMREASCVISNDSANVHMARGVKTPVISIFGPTHPAFGFAPFSDEGRAITLNLPCSPCSLHGRTRCKRQRCFDIDEEFIKTEAIEVMKHEG